MGFNFGNISTKHQERVKHVHSGLVNSCNEAMAEWIENIVGKSRDAGCISWYTFDGRGVCLWLNNTSCKTKDGIPTFTFTINGMILQTCPFSISGIKLDIDKSYFQGGRMLLYISNYTNGPEKKWNTYHSTDWMITDEWANRFGNCSIDLSDFDKVIFKTAFASFNTLKNIVSKFTTGHTKVVLSSKCGILYESPTKRMLYVSIPTYLKIKSEAKKIMVLQGVTVDYLI